MKSIYFAGALLVGTLSGGALSAHAADLGAPTLAQENRLATSTDAASVNQQAQKAVRGTITDSKGEPIIGANVIVRGTSNGCITDFDGKFSLNASRGATLLVSYIGYKPTEVTVGDKSVYNITLQEDNQALDEVVVVGYGTQKKQDLTGSVVSVGEGKFTEGVTTNAFQMITGKAAGVNVSQSSSAPGSASKIQIRGAGSINSSNSALVVVDGMPGVDASSINPADIKSIEVLKDASAAAIYGTRAANGVVLITTKGGKSGDIKVNLNAEWGLQSTAKRLDLLNAQEYMQTLNDIRVASGNKDGKIYTDAQIAAAGEGTDWQDEIFRNGAPVQTYQLSMSGGGEKHDFYVALGYLNQQGVVRTSDLNKYNVRANINMAPKDFLRFKFSTNFTRKDSKQLYENMNGTNEAAGPIASALMFDPTLPSTIDASTGTYYANSYIALDNPLALLNGVKPQSHSNNFYGTFTTEIEPLKDLVATIRVGANVNNTNTAQYRSTLTMTGKASSGIATQKRADEVQWLSEFLLNYKKSFNEVHNLNLLLGATFEQYEMSYLSGTAKGFLSDISGVNDMGSGDSLNGDDVASYKERNRLNGFLGRINYNYRDRYLLTASFRYDGTSRFSDDNKYAFFPSVAAAWRMKEEAFLNDVDFLSDLKLRLGYGQLGNQGIGNYQTIQTLVAGGSAVMGSQLVQGVVLSRLANTNLKWETTAETNVGVDFGFFNNRLSGSLDFYIRDTKDQLFDKPLSSSIGFSSMKVNAGKVRNSGVDITLSSVNFDNKRFGWNTDLNLSFLKNEVKSLPDYTTTSRLITGSISSFISGFELTQVGSAIYSYYGYKVDGVFQTTDDIANSAQPNAKPGELKFQDTNNDGKIDDNDRVILGKPFPDVTLGFTNSFRYKDFTLSVFLQGVFGIKTLDANVLETMYPTNEYRNRLAKYYKNRWTESNPTNKYPSGVNPSNYGGQYSINSMTVVDASFLRIKNINLSYNVPLKRRNVIDAVSVYCAVDNLYTFTSYDGYDPDASASGSTSISKVNYNSYPLARTFRLGFNLTF
jgi:TonB-linked SusC/RagA family outer membrane protein